MFLWFEVVWIDCNTEAWMHEILSVSAFVWVSLAHSLTPWCLSWLQMVLCSCCSISCFFVLYECCLFLDKLSLQPQKILPLLFFLFAVEFCLSDLCATSWSLRCLVLLSGFVICVLAVLVIPLGYIHNSLEMVFLSWFHFVCCCTQTVSLTTVILSCSGFYWHSVSSTFQLFDSFVCSAHPSVSGMLSTFYDLFRVLLWAFPKTCLWTACLCW